MEAGLQVYDGEPDIRCPGSNRRTGGSAAGSMSSNTLCNFVVCPLCASALPHINGFHAASIPPHNVPRVLTKRPKWAKVAP